MANRIMAYIPTNHIGSLSPEQVQQVVHLMTPALNILAGETVFWEKMDGHWCAFASFRAPTVNTRD